MKDLICPECGRPNLGEAKKCWYCQTELVRPRSTESESLPDPAKDDQNRDTGTPQTIDTETEEAPENIPEWLVKVRKRIEADRDPEEELPYWKQKDIFGGEKRISDKTVKDKKEHRRKKADQPELDNNAGNEYEPPGKPDQENKNESLPADAEIPDEIDDLSDELPDGFTKL